MEFERPAKSAEEIEHLPALGSTQCGEYVRTRGQDFSPETLVHIIRRALAAHETVLVELCCRLLLGREETDGRVSSGFCEGTIVKLAKHFRFIGEEEVVREFRRRCYLALWQAIYADHVFWEHRFGLAFRQKSIDVAKSVSRARQRAVDAVAAHSEDDPAGIDQLANESTALLDVTVLDRLARPQHARVLTDAVQRLPKRQAHAALLAWVEGRPIEGKEPNTVASLMDITPRAVYKLLEKAKATLKSDAAVRAIWFGEA